MLCGMCNIYCGWENMCPMPYECSGHGSSYQQNVQVGELMIKIGVPYIMYDIYIYMLYVMFRTAAHSVEQLLLFRKYLWDYDFAMWLAVESIKSRSPVLEKHVPYMNAILSLYKIFE